MVWSDTFEFPDAPENCLSCGKPLTEEQQENGQETCSDICEGDYQTQRKLEAEEEAKAWEAQKELEREGHAYYGSVDPPGREVSDYEEDLAFDAARENRFKR